MLTAAGSESDDKDDDAKFPWLPLVLGAVFLLLCALAAAFYRKRASDGSLKLDDCCHELYDDVPQQRNDEYMSV